MMVLDDLHLSMRGRGETILLVDDETSFVEVTKLLLEISGYSVLTSYDGQEGIATFKKNLENIDVVVCDLHMPIVGGREAIRVFHALKPGIKVLIISGSILEDDIPKYLSPGNIEFLRKPFLTETLLQTLRILLH